jgi:hypothetical protein
MLSTAQALQEWDTVLKLLHEIKQHAAAHAGPWCVSRSLEARMQDSVDALGREVASPVAVWEQLLAQR